jgi:hypothetical protein
MPGFGFGFGSLGGLPQSALFSGADFMPSSVPGPGWNGLAGSGFVSGPVDPVRVTAKPAVRLISPPHQAFTQDITVGVLAMASNNGSLIDNFGLEKVRVYFENDRPVDIQAPRFHTFLDANGNPVTYFAWWITLKKPQGRSGHAQVYFEAVPKDSGMQSRVVGPFDILPSDTLYDHELTVAANGPVVTGESYQTVVAALTYLKSVSAQRPNIMITEAGTYALDVVPGGGYSDGAGWCLIEASVPGVVFGRDAFVSPATTLSNWRPQYRKLWFRGSNITFDMKNVSNLLIENGDRYWFDGVTITNSAGRNSLWLGGPRPRNIFSPATTDPFVAYVTECQIDNLPDCLRGSEIARGNVVSEVFNDIAGGVACLIGNSINDGDTTYFSDDIPALTVHYTGTASTATVSLSGTNNANNRVLTLRENGSTISGGTFTIQNTTAAYEAGTNYTLTNVVDWINSKTNWTATLDDPAIGGSGRRASGLSRFNGIGAFTNLDAKTAPLALATMFDLHSDFYQEGATKENVIIAFNRVWDCEAQMIFLAKGNDIKDVAVVGNGMHSQSDGWGFSQFTGNFSHLVMAHNSWSGQGIRYRVDQGFTCDTYCLTANNTTTGIAFAGGADVANMVISNNHLETGGTAPATATGTTVGGTPLTMFADVEAGDFAPAGELLELANLKAPAMLFDAAFSLRSQLAPAGMRS